MYRKTEVSIWLTITNGKNVIEPIENRLYNASTNKY